jgi:hypothetical protein
MLDHDDVETNEEAEDGVGKLTQRFPGNSPVSTSAVTQAAN